MGIFFLQQKESERRNHQPVNDKRKFHKRTKCKWYCLYWILNPWLAITCAVFAAIYENFSHQVYSPFMICAFLFPIILGIIPNTIRLIRTYKKPLCHTRFSSIACTIQQCGIYTLTVGSILRGILDIYGTTNSTSIIYWWIGGLLLIVGFIIELRP